MKPIGIIRSPWKTLEGMPIQGIGAKGVVGSIRVNPEYADGLKDLDGFSHIILIYVFHESEGYQLRVKPFLCDDEKGVFATRAPKRPNPIGLSIVELTSVTDNVIGIRNVDILDNTPLLDIKPYVGAFDAFSNIRNGWLEDVMHHACDKRSDSRFGGRD